MTLYTQNKMYTEEFTFIIWLRNREDPNHYLDKYIN
jgi:hypothetical protein